MPRESVIIIGAGLAGLSAGIYAQASGYRTRIFEGHTLPGGVCTAWRRGDYLMDICIHWLMGASPESAYYRLYSEVGALDGNVLHPVTHYGRSVHEPTEQTLEITSDLERLRSDMKAISPADGRAVDELVDRSLALRDFQSPIADPPELLSAADKLRQMWEMRAMIPVVMRYNMPVSEFATRFSDPFLQWSVRNVFMPQMPTYFLFAVLGQLAAGKLSKIEGGSPAFVNAIARRYEQLGGEFRYGCGVREILVENDRATGVVLEDGSEYRADAVISAADGHATIFDMLGGRYGADEARKRFQEWEIFPPLVFVSFGSGRVWPAMSGSCIIALQRPLDTGGRLENEVMLRIMSEDRAIAPEGKSAVQLTAPADYDWWCALATDRPRYEAEKRRVAADALDRLESHLPGLGASIEVTDVATPYSFWRYTHNYRAAFEGWMMTPQAVRARVPKTLPGLANFYMAGQWVEPGGGIPPALYSGRNAVRLMCHEDGVPFRAP